MRLVRPGSTSAKIITATCTNRLSSQNRAGRPYPATPATSRRKNRVRLTNRTDRHLVLVRVCSHGAKKRRRRNKCNGPLRVVEWERPSRLEGHRRRHLCCTRMIIRVVRRGGYRQGRRRRLRCGSAEGWPAGRHRVRHRHHRHHHGRHHRHLKRYVGTIGLLFANFFSFYNLFIL